MPSKECFASCIKLRELEVDSWVVVGMLYFRLYFNSCARSDGWMVDSLMEKMEKMALDIVSKRDDDLNLTWQGGRQLVRMRFDGTCTRIAWVHCAWDTVYSGDGYAR